MTDILELEEMLLAAAMARPDLLSSPIVAGDFADRWNGKAWDAAKLAHSRGEPVDPVSLGATLGGDAISRLGSMFKDLSHFSANGEHVARQVKEAGLERRASAIAEEFAAKKISKDELISRLRALESERDMPAVTAYAALKDLVDLLEDPPEAVPTGIGRVDDQFSGLHKGDLVSLVARPAVGKTAMAITMARHMVKAGHPVLFYSGEMPATQVLARLVAQEAQIPAYKFRSGKLSEEEFTRFTQKASEMRDLPLYISDPSYPTLQDLMGTAARIKEKHGLSVVFIDYIQRLQAPKKESFRLEQVYTAKAVKALAREHDVCVVALAQARREVDNYEARAWGQLPGMGDSAESSQIEMESDMILTLARDNATAAIAVQKNRHGPCGVVPLHFTGPTMEFTGESQGVKHGSSQGLEW